MKFVENAKDLNLLRPRQPPPPPDVVPQIVPRFQIKGTFGRQDPADGENGPRVSLLLLCGPVRERPPNPDDIPRVRYLLGKLVVGIVGVLLEVSQTNGQR